MKEKKNEKIFSEANNHTKALHFGAMHLNSNNFNHDFIKKLHKMVLEGEVIKIPFFYISEAISQNKSVYYNKLTDSRKSDYTEWITFF